MKIRFSAHIAIAIISLGLIWKTPVQAQTFSVLYDFGTGTGDPTSPQYPGLIAQGRDGNLYSTGTDGGTNGMGAVFRITPAGKLSVLYSFDGTHGANPNSGLTLGTDGNFYGTTKEGGAFDAGTVFKITPTGSVTVMYSFSGGSDGGIQTRRRSRVPTGIFTGQPPMAAPYLERCTRSHALGHSRHSTRSMRHHMDPSLLLR
jgi:uncharacterized repeat protein (TIGR03803 family)